MKEKFVFWQKITAQNSVLIYFFLFHFVNFSIYIILIIKVLLGLSLKFCFHFLFNFFELGDNDE